MSTGSASLRMARQVNDTILSRTCPLTMGRPTVFYGQDSFSKACQGKQEEAKLYYVEGLKQMERSVPQGRCGQCLGREVPPEIEIRPKGEMMGMGSASSKLGRCGLCDTKSALRSVHQLAVCPTCQRILADVNNRTEVVIGAIKHLQPELLAELVGESVSVGVESVMLKQIGEVVGYAGEDGAELISAVDSMAKGLCDLASKCRVVEHDRDKMTALMERIGEIVDLDDRQHFELLPDAVNGLKSDYSALLIESRAYAEPADVLRALDCGPGQWHLATIQTAALLDDALRDKVINYASELESAAALQAIRKALMITDPMVDLVGAIGELVQGFDRYKGRCDELNGQVRDLERKNVWKDQVLECAGELLQVPGLQYGELVGHIKALRDAAGYYVSGQVQQVQVAECVSGPSIEMAVAGLSIRITGLPVNGCVEAA